MARYLICRFFPLFYSASEPIAYKFITHYKNSFVNLCALKNCIKQGVRCLDFQIYALNNDPVIAVSSVGDFNTKQSFNSIPFANAMNIVDNFAFSGNKCPNPGEPLILHFRICLLFSLLNYF